MRKYRYGIVAAAAIAFAMLMAGTASAAVAVLTYGSTGGPAVAVGDVLTANLVSGTNATFYSSPTGTTGVKCASSSFGATVTSNPATGLATETLDSQSFGSCTSNVSGVTGVKSITVTCLPYNVSADGTVTITPRAGCPIGTTVVLNTLLGTITCTYVLHGSSLNGVTNNADNSIMFTNQQFDKVTGPSLCFTNAYFSAKYGPVHGPGGNVFSN
jgi:hypothetical protein